MSIDRKLTPKQQRFVEEYMTDMNATQAATRAGYSHAKTQGPRLLENVGVARAIAAAQAARSRRTQVTADWVVEQLALIAGLDLRDLFDAKGELRRISDMPEHIAKALAGIEFATVQKGEGAVEHVVKIRTADRLKAFELLGRHLGMWRDGVDVNVTVDLAERIREGRRRAREAAGAAGQIIHQTVDEHRTRRAESREG